MKIFRSPDRVVGSVLLLLIIAAAVAAQSPNTATLLVEINDPAGAVIRGATVSVSNAATGASRVSVSGSSGQVTFSALPLTSTYTIRVSDQGFKDWGIENVTLRAGE